MQTQERERDLQDALTLLKNFSAEMREWETDCGRMMGRANAGGISIEEAKKFLREKLQGIFSRYTTQGGIPKRLQDGGLRFFQPSDYNPRSQEVVTASEGGEKVTVVVRLPAGRGMPAALERRFVYTLVWTQDGWRILDNRMRLRPDGTTTAWDL